MNNIMNLLNIIINDFKNVNYDLRSNSLFLLVFLLSIFVIVNNKTSKYKLLNILNNKMMLYPIILIIILSYYILVTDLSIIKDKYLKRRIKLACRRALISLIIAFYAYTEVLIYPFILIFFTSYFLNIE
jgi:hypothetical protein